MDKEIRNVFFGEIIEIDVSFRGSIGNKNLSFHYDVLLKDGSMVICLGFDGDGNSFLDITPVQMNDPVQVTQWSDGTVTIERFNEI